MSRQDPFGRHGPQLREAGYHAQEVEAVVEVHPARWAEIPKRLDAVRAFRAATEWNVWHKVLFGSDYPIVTPQETIDALWRVNDILEGTKLPPVPIGELEKVLERNSLELLGLE